MEAPARMRKDRAAVVFNIISYTFISLMALVCLLPFFFIISGAF